MEEHGRTFSGFGAVGDPEYWFGLWDCYDNDEAQAITNGHSTAEFWNARSTDYDLHFNDDARRKLDNTLDDLERRGFLSAGMKVIDIGCGTGRMAAALAERGANVVATDFSQGMLGKAAALVTEYSGKRIETVEADWHTVDIDEKGWRGAFDFVIANMTPAIRNAGDLKKMIAVGKRYFYYKGWAEKRRSPILDLLWTKFKGSKPVKRPSPLIFLFNALYASGLYPSIEYQTVSFNREQSYEDVLEQYVTYVHGMFGGDVSEIRSHVGALLDTVAVNGRIVDATQGRTAAILWQTG